MILRFASLDAAERTLVLEIAVITLAVSAGLRALPFGVLTKAIGARPRRARPFVVSPHRTAQLVEAVTRRIPGSTCLVKALVLFRVLLGRGVTTEVVVAAARTSGRFDAHAWVRLQDDVILGGAALDGYVPVLVLRAHGASSAVAA